MKRIEVWMLREQRAALRYSALGSSSDAPFNWPDDEAGLRNDALERCAARLGEAVRAQSPPSQRGVKTMQKIAARLEKRQVKSLRQSALDLLRLEDLQDRAAQRSAVALRQRWFVIGRALDAAMQADARIMEAVMAVLDQADLRQNERALLGLKAKRAKSE